MQTPEKLHAPEIRELTPAEHQQMTDLIENMVQQALGSNWKERQAEPRIARPRQALEQKGAAAE
jgi:hypothetical protein